jgi:hypothetical protein
MPFYHHGVVVEAVELAFEQESKAEDLTALLAALGGTGVISQTQVGDVAWVGVGACLLIRVAEAGGTGERSRSCPHSHRSN